MLDLNYDPAVLVEDITQLTEEEWLRERTKGIGGSDVAAVLGISPWKTRRDLFYEKTGVQPMQPDESNWVAKEVGHHLEELVAEIYRRKTGYTVYPIRKIFQHPLYPFMIADVDYFVQKPNGKRGVLECKTSSLMAKDRWADDGIPRHYEVQGKHYLSVTNLDFCAFACLFGNSEGDFLMREIGRDLEEEEMTILELAHFWQNFVVANVEPPYTESGDLVLESIRRYQGKADPSLPQITLSSAGALRLEQCLKLWEEKQALDKRGRELEKEIKGVYAPIVDRMGQACAAICTVGTVEYRVSYKPTSKTGIKKDELERLRLDHPDIYDQYATTSESRSFAVKRLDKLQD